jgi:hypothetical protein
MIAATSVSLEGGNASSRDDWEATQARPIGFPATATSALERRLHADIWRHWRSTPDGWDTFVADLVQVLQALLAATSG